MTVINITAKLVDTFFFLFLGNKHLLSKNKMWAELLQHYEKNYCLVDENWPWQ